MRKYIMCIIVIMLLSISAASETIDKSSNGVSVGSASGDDAKVSTDVKVTNDEITASSIAEASASDGKTAIARAYVDLSFFSKGMAFTESFAYGVSKIGEVVYVKAVATASVLKDGTSTAHAESVSYKEKTDLKLSSISGYVFGDSDFDRYCLWKSQLNNSDTNISTRAKRNIDNMLYDSYYPLNMTRYEELIRKENNLICKAGNLTLKDRLLT